MSFKNWVLERYLGKDSIRGDFAEDLSRVKDAPEEDDKERWLSHLWIHHACPEAVDVFKRMWADYDRQRKRR